MFVSERESVGEHKFREKCGIKNDPAPFGAGSFACLQSDCVTNYTFALITPQ
jgi:hypothetical protein